MRSGKLKLNIKYHVEETREGKIVVDLDTASIEPNDLEFVDDELINKLISGIPDGFKRWKCNQCHKWNYVPLYWSGVQICGCDFKPCPTCGRSRAYIGHANTWPYESSYHFMY